MRPGRSCKPGRAPVRATDWATVIRSAVSKAAVVHEHSAQQHTRLLRNIDRGKQQRGHAHMHTTHIPAHMHPGEGRYQERVHVEEGREKIGAVSVWDSGAVVLVS